MQQTVPCGLVGWQVPVGKVVPEGVQDPPEGEAGLWPMDPMLKVSFWQLMGVVPSSFKESALHTNPSLFLAKMPIAALQTTSVGSPQMQFETQSRVSLTSWVRK